MKRARAIGLVSALLAAATAAIVALTAPAVASPVQPAPPYHVSGNKVLGKNGERFVPYGFVIDCASFDQSARTLCNGTTNQDPWRVDQMVSAAAGFWHSDVIRLQVAVEQLLPSSGAVDARYLRLIHRIVTQATALHLVTIITLQTEKFHGPPLPTTDAIRFWAVIAKHFKHNPRVMFDLYNEPRLLPSKKPPILTEKQMWNIWQHGGSYNGTTYVGDQVLVKTIRKTGASNVIIAESNKFDRDLTLLESHLLTDPRGNLVYGVEPNLNAKHKTRAEWRAYFGALAHKLPIFPEALLPKFQECNRAAPTIFPKLLRYLGEIHMGAIVWTLLPGITTVGTNLQNPTTFAPSRAATDPCLTKGTPVTKHTTYGEGKDVLHFFSTGL